MRLRLGRLIAAACLLVLLAAATPAGAAGPYDGQVSFFKAGSPQTDQLWGNADAAGPGPGRDTLTARYDRVRSFAPFFDRFTSWFKNSWPYENTYAVYPDEVPGPKDQYVLRDSQGQRMYISFWCGSDGTCPQYAADITNPAWRAAWIEEVRQDLAGGDYKGIAIDDVNFDRKVCGDVGATCEESVTPINYQGRPLTLKMWKRAMADFMEQVRLAFPGREIVQNQVFFFAGGLAGGVPVDADVRRAIAATDLLNVERGYHDPNFNDDSFAQLRAWVRYAHKQGKGVVLEAQTDEDPEFALATYFMDAKEGVTDYLSHPYRSLPGDWWEGWDIDLGRALQPEATKSEGWIRRDFEHGSVFVGGPRQWSIQRNVAQTGGQDEPGRESRGMGP